MTDEADKHSSLTTHSSVSGIIGCKRQHTDNSALFDRHSIFGFAPPAGLPTVVVSAEPT